MTAHWIALLALFAAAPQEPAPAEMVVSPFNQLAIRNGIHDRPFRFLAGGHLYGSPLNKKSIHPSSSLLAGLEDIEASGAEFFVGLGDIVRLSEPAHWNALDRAFLTRLPMPFFNARGNHDGRKVYEQRYGSQTYSSIVFGHTLFLFLDTELDAGRITGDQLGFLKARLAEAREDPNLRSVVVSAHRLLFAPGVKELEVVFRNINNAKGYQQDGSFQRDVLPALRQTAALMPVVWLSGDIGVRKYSLPLFHHREQDVDLTWIAAGLGDTEEDALLLFSVQPTGAISVEVLRLDGGPSPALETFGVESWKARVRGK